LTHGVVAVRTEQSRRVFTVRHFSRAAVVASIARSARILASRRENAETLVASPRSADLLRAVLATPINPLIRHLGLHTRLRPLLVSAHFVLFAFVGALFSAEKRCSCKQTALLVSAHRQHSAAFVEIAGWTLQDWT